MEFKTVRFAELQELYRSIINGKVGPTKQKGEVGVEILANNL